MMFVEVAYALPNEQIILTVRVQEDCKVIDAIEASGILQRFPEIDLLKNKVGIFGKVTSLETVLQVGDRVEIYRPLIIDPKEARKERAKKAPSPQPSPATTSCLLKNFGKVGEGWGEGQHRLPCHFFRFF